MQPTQLLRPQSARRPAAPLPVAAVFAEAVRQHQAGRLAEAESGYRRVLTVAPRHADARHLLGVVAAQCGRRDIAVAQIGEAIRIDPNVGTYHTSLGTTLLDLGQAEAALASFRRAVALRPDEVLAHLGIGNILSEQGRLEEAAASYRAVLALQPNMPEAHYNLANVLRQLREHEDAAAHYLTALAFRPDVPEGHNNLGTVFGDLDRPEEAAACYRVALALRPDYIDALHNLGSVLPELGAMSEALDCCHRAIALAPEAAIGHANLANVFWRLGRLSEALDSAVRAVQFAPEFAQAHSVKGNVLRDLGRPSEAILSHQRAAALSPDKAEVLNNFGNSLRDEGRLEEAITCFRRAVAVKPALAAAHLNLGLALLANGELLEGWREYEWRWQMPQLSRQLRTFAQPRWYGEPAAGRTLLVYSEQGFGDTLQFCRLLPRVAARGLRVVLEVEPALVRLLDGLPGAVQVVAAGAPLPAFDLHSPLLSLPLALGLTLDAIPSADAYLHADPAAADAWRRRLGADDRRLRVGLVWAGSARQASPALAAVDRRRSIDPQLLAPLFEVAGVRFFSLQKLGPSAPAAFPLTDAMGEMGDFADTAALIANLDLVISVDTAVAHLAAALGRPVWLLDRADPCWRWLTGRRDSPWYPSLRIYRQPRHGDWAAVLAEVLQDLRGIARP